MAAHLATPLSTYQTWEAASGQGTSQAVGLAARACTYAVICARMEGGIPGWPPPDLATLETLAREAELLARKRRRE